MEYQCLKSGKATGETPPIASNNRTDFEYPCKLCNFERFKIGFALE